MVTRVVPVRAHAVVGDTVMVHGWPAVVVDLLPRERGRPRTARVTHDPPCRACERSLPYEAPRRRWRCPGCNTIYAPASLAAMCREAERSARRLQRGIPGLPGRGTHGAQQTR